MCQSRVSGQGWPDFTVVPPSSIVPDLSFLPLPADPVSEDLSVSEGSRQAGVELEAKLSLWH